MFVSIEKWYIANIIFLMTLKSKYRVHYNDNDQCGVFMVHPPCRVVKFLPFPHVQHYLDLKYTANMDMILMTTVQENYWELTKKGN